MSPTCNCSEYCWNVGRKQNTTNNKCKYGFVPGPEPQLSDESLRNRFLTGKPHQSLNGNWVRTNITPGT